MALGKPGHNEERRALHPLNRPYLAPSRRWDGRTIGLYGGSFNPAHMGHLHVSLRALKRLKLDGLWWLVSPLNPLKHASDIAPLALRVRRAQTIAKHPKIHVCAPEDDLQTRFSVETIAHLRARFPKTCFVWIMGADNLATFHHWEGWEMICDMLPIAVVDRPGYSQAALWSPAARRLRRHRVAKRMSYALPRMQPPAWVFLTGPLHQASATAIRARSPEWAQKAET